MSERASPALLVLLPAIALAVLAAGLTSSPRAPSGVVVAALAGAAAGGALFALLGGRPRHLRPPAPDRRLPAAALGCLLAASAASEEVVWRGLLLGRFVPEIGVAAAFAVTTLGFAAAHGPRRFPVQLATGAAFGGVFLATGSLVAAVVSHVAYNLLVLLGRESDREVVLKSVASAPVVAESVHKRLGSVEALRGASLAVRQGEIVALLGPNGAGKTTLLNVLLGLRRPDRGETRLFGLDPRRTAARTRLGFTPQEQSFPPTLRVGEVVDLVRAHYQGAVPDLLARFGLEEVAQRQTGGLSGGERRRLAVALAFVGDPRLVVLDEPTTGLDVESRHRVWAAIRDYAETDGTVLLTTHDLHEAEALATRIAVIVAGQVVAEGSVAEIRARAGLKRVGLRAGALPDLPAVERRVREPAGLWSLYTADAGAVVRALVAHGSSLEELEVEPVSLEEAFLGLTRRPG